MQLAQLCQITQSMEVGKLHLSMLGTLIPSFQRKALLKHRVDNSQPSKQARTSCISNHSIMATHNHFLQSFNRSKIKDQLISNKHKSIQHMKKANRRIAMMTQLVILQRVKEIRQHHVIETPYPRKKTWSMYPLNTKVMAAREKQRDTRVKSWWQKMRLQLIR